MKRDESALPEVWIGTSGWVYRHWDGLFYPPEVRGERQLPFYAERYRTVEINYSFYRLPERAVFAAWRRQSPEGFLFAVKGSRYLTHLKKLKDPEEPLARLMESAGGLEEKLGPVLFQFPRWWTLNLERLRAFLPLLTTSPRQRFAFEFRHESWLTASVYDLLEGAGAALCLPVGPGVPCDPRLTAPWTYVRMHSGWWGTGFTDGELDDWAGRVRSFREQGAEAYIYFNNDPDGHALADADRFRARLGIARAAGV